MRRRPFQPLSDGTGTDRLSGDMTINANVKPYVIRLRNENVYASVMLEGPADVALRRKQRLHIACRGSTSSAGAKGRVRDARNGMEMIMRGREARS